MTGAYGTWRSKQGEALKGERISPLSLGRSFIKKKNSTMKGVWERGHQSLFREPPKQISPEAPQPEIPLTKEIADF